MADVKPFRALVVARAGGACEYCRPLEAATGVTFHVEHVLPQSLGGMTTLDNLALSCPGCNLAKGPRVSGRDAHGTMHPLFNPRGYRPWTLGWHLHFDLHRSTGRILAKTPLGEAPILAMDINATQRAFARKLQIDAGLIA